MRDFGQNLIHVAVVGRKRTVGVAADKAASERHALMRCSLGMLACLAGAACGGCAPMSFLITPVPEARRLQESEVLRESAWASKKIALIDVSGVIHNSRNTSLLGAEGENPVVEFQEKLDRAAADKHVKAVVVRINSPGGGVTASDLMYDALLQFRQRTAKPVIASMIDLAASGGYYIACGCERIFALPTTVTGSIGVIMITPDLTGAMQKLGVRTNVIKSGPMKDTGSPFREMSEADRQFFQSMINQMYERFLAVVAKGRPNVPPERLRELADGRVYTADEAKRNGLVDDIGTLREALLDAKRAAGMEKDSVIVVEYHRPAEYRPNIYAKAPDAPSQVNLINVSLPSWLTEPGPQFMYLWSPGW